MFDWKPGDKVRPVFCVFISDHGYVHFLSYPDQARFEVMLTIRDECFKHAQRVFYVQPLVDLMSKFVPSLMRSANYCCPT